MNRYCSIAHHGFRTSGSNFNTVSAVFGRITEVIDFAFLVYMVYFNIGNSGLAVRTPVNNIVALVNQAFVVQTYKCFAYCFGAAFIHSKAFTVPVTGAAQFAQLCGDGIAVFFFPCPGAAQKFFTAYFETVGAFFFQLCFYFCLSSNPGMVGTRYP